MKDQHPSYYVPDYSAWPLLGACGFALFGIGSLNYELLTGKILNWIGIVLLIIVLVGWLKQVFSESNKGFYSPQLVKTFKWGIFWFIVSDFVLMGVVLGGCLAVRFSILPWIAGERGGGSLLTHYLLWPDFSAHWPLLKAPSTKVSNFPQQILHRFLMSTTIILVSVTFVISYAYKQKKQKKNPQILLGGSLILIALFLFLSAQFFYSLLWVKQVSFQSGVYLGFLVSIVVLIVLNAVLLFLSLLSAILDYGFGNKTLGYTTVSIDFCNALTLFLLFSWICSYLCIF